MRTLSRFLSTISHPTTIVFLLPESPFCVQEAVGIPWSCGRQAVPSPALGGGSCWDGHETQVLPIQSNGKSAAGFPFPSKNNRPFRKKTFCDCFFPILTSLKKTWCLALWQLFCDHEVSHIGSMGNMQRTAERKGKKKLGPWWHCWAAEPSLELSDSGLVVKWTINILTG